MIVIDTNALLSYVMGEMDISPSTSQLISHSHQVLISDVVLVEAIWILRGKKYRLNNDGVSRLIERLFKMKNFVFEESQSVWRAVKEMQQAPHSRSADVVVLEKAHFAAARKSGLLHDPKVFQASARQARGVYLESCA